MKSYSAAILLFVTIVCMNLLTTALTAAADDPSDQQSKKSEDNKENHLTRKLSGNEPSYFVFARDNNGSFNNIEFYLSLKYPLFENVVHRLLGPNIDLYFNYNGKYDFYLESRPSSPVISRRQNPGAMFTYNLEKQTYGLASIKTGYFHESNGQTIDTATEYATTEYAEDFVSRGWDYIPLELRFSFPEQLEGFTFYFKGRYFLPKQIFSHDKEDTIFWDLTDDSKISDYDGLTLVLRKTVPINKYLKDLKLTAVYRTGYTDFNLTQRYEATFSTLDLPVYIFYQSGYGIEISTYQERGYTWGIGVEFM
jgi:outer membrane phospholipase A